MPQFWYVTVERASRRELDKPCRNSVVARSLAAGLAEKYKCGVTVNTTAGVIRVHANAYFRTHAN